MNNYDCWNLIIQAIVAFGTLSAVVVAIWGNIIRSKVVGPKVEFSLRSPQGHFTTFQNGEKACFYHIKVNNKRIYSPAIKGKVMVIGIYKKDASGFYTSDNLAAVPIQLTWVYSNVTPPEQNVSGEHFCDLGYVTENEKRFWLSTYHRPNNFQGWISKDVQSMKIRIVLVADNYRSKPKNFDITWDGTWTTEISKMKRHLVIKELDNNSD